MAGENLAGTGQDLDTSLPTIFSEFKLLRDYPGVCKKLATHKPLQHNTGASKNVINYGRFTADQLVSGQDITRSQNLADANTAYTPYEVGLKVLIPKETLRHISDKNLLRSVGRMMENAYSLKEDQDGCAQFTSWTPIVGAAGTVSSAGLIAAAKARLDIGNNRDNPEPFGQNRAVGVFHPLHLHHIYGRLIPFTDVPVGTTAYSGVAAGQTIGPGRTGMSDDLIREGVKALGKIAGVTIYGDGNIAVDASDDASGAVFDPEGFYYVEDVAADLNQKMTDASARSEEIVGWGAFTFGLYRPGASGVEYLADATLPTA